jgi:hypothetical protein
MFYVYRTCYEELWDSPLFEHDSLETCVDWGKLNAARESWREWEFRGDNWPVYANWQFGRQEAYTHS